jgi:hypothetical protein
LHDKVDNYSLVIENFIRIEQKMTYGEFFDKNMVLYEIYREKI